MFIGYGPKFLDSCLWAEEETWRNLNQKIYLAEDRQWDLHYIVFSFFLNFPSYHLPRCQGKEVSMNHMYCLMSAYRSYSMVHGSDTV